jgi:hypothetical protein
MQMLMPADAGAGECMHTTIILVCLFTEVSIFGATGYRKLELNTWGPHSNCVEVSIIPAVQPYLLVPDSRRFEVSWCCS